MTREHLAAIVAWLILAVAFVWLVLSPWLIRAMDELDARIERVLAQGDDDFSHDVSRGIDEAVVLGNGADADRLVFMGSVLADIDEFCGGAA